MGLITPLELLQLIQFIVPSRHKKTGSELGRNHHDAMAYEHFRVTGPLWAVTSGFPSQNADKTEL